jgi:hypothetical protein
LPEFFVVRVELLLEPERDPFFGGTLAPFRRASDNPIAIVCFTFFTLRPDLPDRSVPRFFLCITRATLFEAFGLYFLAIRGLPLSKEQQRLCQAESSI